LVEVDANNPPLEPAFQGVSPWFVRIVAKHNPVLGRFLAEWPGDIERLRCGKVSHGGKEQVDAAQGDTKRKAIVWICTALIAATCLFPPWSSSGRIEIAKGYAWLFNPPDQLSHVDLSRLVVQWVLIAVVGLALYAVGPPFRISRKDENLKR
jgi:hypothetical protein